MPAALVLLRGIDVRVRHVTARRAEEACRRRCGIHHDIVFGVVGWIAGHPVLVHRGSQLRILAVSVIAGLSGWRQIQLLEHFREQINRLVLGYGFQVEHCAGRLGWRLSG